MLGKIEKAPKYKSTQIQVYDAAALIGYLSICMQSLQDNIAKM